MNLEKSYLVFHLYPELTEGESEAINSAQRKKTAGALMVRVINVDSPIQNGTSNEPSIQHLCKYRRRLL